jgi:hypothetical protein
MVWRWLIRKLDSWASNLVSDDSVKSANCIDHWFYLSVCKCFEPVSERNEEEVVDNQERPQWSSDVKGSAKYGDINASHHDGI